MRRVHHNVANDPEQLPEPDKRGTCPIRAIAILAEAVLSLHLLWCGWVLLGWTVTRCRPLLRTLHIASLIYAIVIELVPWLPCPLTMAETVRYLRELRAISMQLCIPTC